MTMTLDQLIEIVNEAYPDDMVQLAHQGEVTGDGLAQFIASELASTYGEYGDDSALIVMRAFDAMYKALDELQWIVDVLDRKAYELRTGKKRRDALT